METVYLILGSNIGDREDYLRQAVVSLSHTCGKVLRLSGIYESEPWGFDHPVWFLNQVVEIETEHGADEILRSVQKIEQSLGRIRTTNGYQPRTIDIDILFYNNHIINTPDLIIPHPHIPDRMFVLEPLSDLAPDRIHPVLKKTINDLKKYCTDQLMVRPYAKRNDYAY